jgi:3-dehydroquinate dehydratase-1
MPPKPILVNGKPLAEGRLPAVCAPLVGRTRDALLAEARAVAAKQPDLLEWRVDFFQDLADTGAVLDVAGQLRRAAGGIPLLFTRRSQREGGEPIALAEPQVVDLYRAIGAGGHMDLVDFEMGNDPEHVQAVREASRRHGQGLVLSYHNFGETPGVDFLVQRFAQAEQLAADVAKVAVMPRHQRDLLVVLDATLRASEERAIPVVSMAMGGWGALTRLCGWAFGSALTFAVGGAASAPGQLPIEDMRAGLALLHQAVARAR